MWKCFSLHSIKLQDNCSIKSGQCQGTPDKEIKEKFEPKKKQSILLAGSYARIGYEHKSENVENCGTFLEFAKTADCDFRLHKANFCRDRLCPMCSWRRSYKIFSQVSQIMSVICDSYCYLFLTLTVPNCSADELSDCIDGLSYAWYKFSHYKRFKDAVKGYFKALEITRNKSNGSYHPHFHVVLAVDKKYFKDSKYIKRDEWLALWQKATKDKSITQVDIRRAKGKKDGSTAVKALSSAVAEIAKYAVKSADYIIVDNEPLMDDIVFTLSYALHGRRLCAFGGVFEEVRRQLMLDDVEDGDLIHVDGNISGDLAVQIYRYGWSCGCYKLIEIDTPAKGVSE